MTLAAIPGGYLRVPTFQYERGVGFTWSALTGVATAGLIDATTEKFAWIGNIKILDGSASKTFSSGGGKIHYIAGAACTFAATGPASTIDVGFQDTTQASAARLPDGTFDTKGTLTSGVDTITSSVVNTVTMSSGTKTITDGMKGSIVFDMTARNGADSVKIASTSTSTAAYTNNPGCAQYVSAAWSVPTAGVNYGPPCVLIEFDDGTFGIFEGGFWAPPQSTHASIQSSSNPDEYGLRFTVPFKCELWGFEIPAIPVATPATGTVAVARLCSGPAATPSLVTSENIDGYDHYANANASSRTFVKLTTPPTLVPGTTYYATLRISSTMTFTFPYLSYPAAGQLAALPFGINAYKVSRDGDTVGTGAFTEVTTDILPVTLLLSKLDDGVGGATIGGTPMLRGMV